MRLRQIAISVVGIAIAALARGDDMGAVAEAGTVVAPGGGEMVILAPSSDYVLEGHVDDSGQVEADCEQDAAPEPKLADDTDGAHE